MGEAGLQDIQNGSPLPRAWLCGWGCVHSIMGPRVTQEKGFAHRPHRVPQDGEGLPGLLSCQWGCVQWGCCGA